MTAYHGERSEIKYGVGYVRVIEPDGSEIRVTIEKKKTLSGAFVPYEIKEIAKLVETLR